MRKDIESDLVPSAVGYLADVVERNLSGLQLQCLVGDSQATSLVTAHPY